MFTPRGRRALHLLVAFAAGTAVAAATAGIAVPDPGDAMPAKPTTEWLTAKVGAALGVDGVTSWVPSGAFDSSAEVRVPRYPFQIEGRDTRDLTVSAVRNEQVSAQIAVAATHRLSGLTATVSGLSGLPAPRIRTVQYVPVMRSKTELDWSATVEDVSSPREVSGDRNPDVVGDALADRSTVDVPAYAAQPFWFTFTVPRTARPGSYQGTIKLAARGITAIEYPLTITVADPVLPDAKDYKFFMDVWLQPETIAHYAGVRPWSPAHWPLLEPYFRDLLSRGQKVINTTIVDNPWHHQWGRGRTRSQTYLPYQSMVGWTWDGRAFGFDFGRFDRYVEAARQAGLGPTIGAFSMLAFQTQEHLTYFDLTTGKLVTEPVELGGRRWRQAWAAFLTEFQEHLQAKGWLADTWLSFDERPADMMAVIRDFVHEVAPAFGNRISVAGSVTTAGIASNLSVDWGGIDQLTPELVEQRRREGKTTTFYVYGLPAHPNTLSYSPAVESRMLPWIAASKRLDGFLRWAYNSWPQNVFADPVFIFSQGDEYLVYPGRGGPMSSVRWEQLREGVEDFELIIQLRARTGSDPEALRQAFTLATRDLDGRSKNPRDIAEARKLVVQELTR
ncbi:DUF4091 domain-containing protein [Kibdelosporangium aridum]|uniref:DUF4091 domain-containing protein n=1 Tax=Kibdelosporangium aridum TaxID=2030 RepID=A0A428ZTW8_KIBAR|nr:DUF4091 domain-containing protein [Kibdelosporangium aridum]RSM91488.1 DUF4091 domain-containing protein [Kibdelosporangium aridum]